MYTANELILNFWVWWYYEGLTDLVSRQLDIISRTARFTGLTTHIRYLLTPLYQQTGLMSRGFSLFFRLGMIALGIVAVAAVLFVNMLFFLGYLALPILPIIYLWTIILQA